MNYTLVTDASYCPVSKIAVGAAVTMTDNGEVSKPRVWHLDAENSFDAELQTLVLGIRLVPPKAQLTAFSDVQSFGYQYNKLKNGIALKSKQAKKIKPLTKATKKRRQNTDILWAGEFGKDHQLLKIVHKAAYNTMKSMRGNKNV